MSESFHKPPPAVINAAEITKARMGDPKVIAQVFRDIVHDYEALVGEDTDPSKRFTCRALGSAADTIERESVITVDRAFHVYDKTNGFGSNSLRITLSLILLVS